MRRIANFIRGIKAPLLMILSQLLLAGLNIMYKLAADDGMSLRIVIVYRFLFAAAVMIPLAVILERKSFAKINRMVLFYAFLCGLFGGSLGQNLYLQSLVYTSTTYATAMMNLAPAFTFILGIFFKLEKLRIGSKAGKAKVLGTLIGIGGAMAFTFYRGPDITIWTTNVNVLHNRNQPANSSKGTDKFILGAVLGFLSVVAFALWLIVQAKVNMIYPYLLTTTALMCIMGSTQAAIFAFCVERDWSQWKLGWNIRLAAVSYAGLMGSSLMVFLFSWGVRLRGPLYASIFNPVGLVFIAIAGSLILDEKLHLGSIIGGVLIVCGLYLVLWGKAKEMRQNAQLMPTTDEDIDEERSEREKEEDDDQSENEQSILERIRQEMQQTQDHVEDTELFLRTSAIASRSRYVYRLGSSASIYQRSQSDGVGTSRGVNAPSSIEMTLAQLPEGLDAMRAQMDRQNEEFSAHEVDSRLISQLRTEFQLQRRAMSRQAENVNRLYSMIDAVYVQLGLNNDIQLGLNSDIQLVPPPPPHSQDLPGSHPSPECQLPLDRSSYVITVSRTT